MSDSATPVRLSSRPAGTLTKRKPRSARSRGSMRRSVTLSSEKRKPRSASAARLSFSIGPICAQRRLGELEHQRRRDRAVRLQELDELRERLGVDQRRGRHIAEQADLAVLRQQAAHHLDAAEHHQVVDLRHQPAGFGVGQEIGRHAAGRRRRRAAAPSPRSSGPCAAAASRSAAGRDRCGSSTASRIRSITAPGSMSLKRPDRMRVGAGGAGGGGGGPEEPAEAAERRAAQMRFRQVAAADRRRRGRRDGAGGGGTGGAGGSAALV